MGWVWLFWPVRAVGARFGAPSERVAFVSDGGWWYDRRLRGLFDAAAAAAAAEVRRIPAMKDGATQEEKKRFYD